MFLIDSHCHLDYEPMASDIEGTLRRAHENGIKGFLTICTDLAKIPILTTIADKHEEVFATIGVHPHEAAKTLSKEKLFQLLVDEASHPKVVGFGETGLDYYYENSPKEAQLDAFEAHIGAAVACDLPLIVHTREAEEDTIHCLKHFGQGKVKGVMHCFTGTPWLRDQALEIGFYISVSGILTFNNAETLRETIREVPLDRLLVETDAPFLAPQPFRGKPNEPSYLIETVKKLAEVKGEKVEDICKATTQNFLTLFSKVKL